MYVCIHQKNLITKVSAEGAEPFVVTIYGQRYTLCFSRVCVVTLHGVCVSRVCVVTLYGLSRPSTARGTPSCVCMSLCVTKPNSVVCVCVHVCLYVTKPFVVSINGQRYTPSTSRGTPSYVLCVCVCVCLFVSVCD
jgi:hypothetical protein